MSEPFEVVEPKLEMGDTAMNEPLLRQMAQASGGGFYREEDLHHLPEDVQRKTETVRSTIDVPLWSSPIYFLILIGSGYGRMDSAKDVRFEMSAASGSTSRGPKPGRRDYAFPTGVVWASRSL